MSRLRAIVAAVSCVVFLTSCSGKSDPQGIVDDCLKAYAAGNESAALAYIQAIQLDSVFHDLQGIARMGKWTFSNKMVGPAKATIEVRSEHMNVLVELLKTGDSWLIVTDRRIR